MDDKHRAGIAAILSFVFNGLGQIYNGKIKKGLNIMVISSLAMVMIVIGAVFMVYWLLEFLGVAMFISGAILFLIGVIVACLVGVRCIYDAYEGN